MPAAGGGAKAARVLAASFSPEDVAEPLALKWVQLTPAAARREKVRFQAGDKVCKAPRS